VIVALSGLGIETIGHLFHAHDMRKQGGEGAASHYEQTTTFGNSYQLRNILLAFNLLGLVAASVLGLSGQLGVMSGIVLAFSLIISSILSRALFYVLVIPTTMPGAFFWRNKGFEQHARETGLANMPQLGVVPDNH
jgi:hypothetical protein